MMCTSDSDPEPQTLKHPKTLTPRCLSLVQAWPRMVLVFWSRSFASTWGLRVRPGVYIYMLIYIYIQMVSNLLFRQLGP